ncbi:MAG TPA: hypothetical protein VJT50_03285, partial [Pyrinomonadaceae bacterium]|nr:hypothetical protein [Pyrinomonadaceae bacterium]
MHGLAGRTIKLAPLWLLACLLLLAPSSLTAQEKTQDKHLSDATAKPAETPPAEPQKTGNELDGPVIVNTDLITFTVTVTDTYGRYVSGLGKNAFTVMDDKKPQEITFFSDDDSPVSVGVIFDVSGSMGG